MNVLLVEDEAANRAAIAKLLERAGFRVSAAADGLQAFDQLDQQRFEVIVSDLRMPELGGASFYEQLEERYPTMCSRTLFVTAVADEPPIRAFLERTGQPFLMKPFQPDELVAQVKALAQQVLD